MLRRAGRAATVAAALLLIAPATAGAAKMHFSKLDVAAKFQYQLDYGDHPDSNFNSIYVATRAYQMRAIVAFKDRAIGIAGRNAVVSGWSEVWDFRTVVEDWAAPERRRVPIRPCVEPAGGTYSELVGGIHHWGASTGGGGLPVFRRSRSAEPAGVAVGFNRGGVLDVWPGNSAWWVVGCSATENPAYHGLEPGPGFAVTAPNPKRFRGTKPFSKTCDDSFSHPPDAEVNGHSFYGTAAASVRFIPFPKSKLDNKKRQLREMVGREHIAREPEGGRDCLLF